MNDTPELDGMPPRQVLVRHQYKLLTQALLMEQDEVPELGAAHTLRHHIHTTVTKVTKHTQDGITVYTVVHTEDDPEDGKP